jgi:2,4-dienoyl-CoA reductase-like NADH-dependent reductase (Old Yellow Enzyme family)/thioredoxin reductase
MNPYYPLTFTPITVGNVTFKNRILASPVTTNRIVENGYPTPEGIDVYETRARGGFAQVTFTESFVDNEYASRHEHGLNIYSDEMSTIHMESIMTLTEAIKAHGAVASIQLNHVGAVNHPDTIMEGNNPIGPSPFIRPDGVQVDGMDEAMMRRVASNFASVALNCKCLGFNMIMLHGGHGWLLSQFISPLSNHRTDEYGGSLENRARFPIMVIDAVRKSVGDGFPIEYRISGDERVPGGMGIDEAAEFCRLIQDRVDMIHVTSGIYHSHVETKAFSSMFDPHGCNLDLAAAVKRVVDIPVVAVGGFNAPEQIEEALASGKCDFVALGRQQFADPAFADKAMTGRADEIAPCLRCSCFNPLPPDPDDRPTPELWQCAVNPWAGRELRWRVAPVPKQRRRVLVIGGGVSGMYAALTAAERGPEVILAERSDRLGGILRFTDIDEHKESLRRFRDSLIVRCGRSGVDIRTGAEVTSNYIREIDPYAVICAVGSSAIAPPIDGIAYAVHALDMYDNRSAVGKSVVMIGGGLIGCETGLWLAENGHAVHIIEMRDGLAIDANDSHRRALLPRLAKAATWDTGARVVKIDTGGVHFIDDSGTEKYAEADTVVYATGQRANADTADSLKEACVRFVTIGDARMARQVKQATYEGFCAAMDIV